MTYTMTWLHPKRIAYVNVYGHYTMDDVQNALDEIKQYGAQTDQAFFVVGDTSGITRYEQRTGDVIRIFSQYTPPPNLARVLVIAPSPHLRLLGQMGAQVAGLNLRFMGSMDKILQAITLQDETLPDTRTLLEQYHALQADR